MSLQDQLLAIERELWTNDPLIYRQHLIEEAVLVFGETGPIGRDTAIDAIRKEVDAGDGWTKVDITGVISMTLGTDSALLTYRASAARKRESVTVLATSVYVRRGEDWKLALHQQTEVA
ncbi:MAG: hypothetical protein AB7O49_08280 [Sphingomonadales bacterium]